MSLWNWGGGEQKTRRKSCPSATLSTTNPTLTALDANQCLRGEKPATNRLSYGTAITATNTNKYFSRKDYRAGTQNLSQTRTAFTFAYRFSTAKLQMRTIYRKVRFQVLTAVKMSMLLITIANRFTQLFNEVLQNQPLVIFLTLRMLYWSSNIGFYFRCCDAHASFQVFISEMRPSSSLDVLQ
jgi:hypothetical protein